MSTLGLPYLDLTFACQRHTGKRTSYVTARPPFDPSRFGVEPIDAADARISLLSPTPRLKPSTPPIPTL